MRTFYNIYKLVVVPLLFVIGSECFSWQGGVHQNTIFANRSQEAIFRWKYVLGQAMSENLEITCSYIPITKKENEEIVEPKVLVRKVGHTKPLSTVGNLPGGNGRVEAYQENLKDGMVDRSIVGFKIVKAQLTHPTRFVCKALYEEKNRRLGNKLSKVKKLVVLDPPQLIDCLEGLPTVKEGKDIELSCSASGNPPPILQCQLLNGWGEVLRRIPEQAKAQNISRQKFVAIPREAEQIMCIAKGGEHTGVVNKTIDLEVHHTPSVPAYVHFINAVNISSLNLYWSEIRDNETGGEILGYLIEYWRTKEDTRIQRSSARLKLKQLRILHEGYFSHTLFGLYPDDEYTVELSGYNQYGDGHIWTGKVTPSHIKPIEPAASSASVGAVIGGIIAGIVFIVIFVVLAVWCSTRSNKGEKLPTSHIEDAVDYPQEAALYTGMDKNRNNTSVQGSMRGEYPDVLNGTTETRPLPNSSSYEPSNKSFV